MKRQKNTYSAICVTSLIFLFSPAYAVTADDVDCNSCVDTTDIALDAVTSTRIKDGQIRNQDLAVNAITSDRIKDGQIRNQDLSVDAITSNRIKDGQVRNQDLADLGVTEDKLAQALQDKINATTGVPVTVAIDCDANAEELRFTQFTKYSTYNITGACNGPVYVTEDGVSLTGTNSNTADSIVLPAGQNGVAVVFAQGANGLKITNLFLDATQAVPADEAGGLWARNSYVRLIDSRIQGSSYAMNPFRNGTIELYGTNTITEYFLAGMSAGDNSNITTRGPTTVTSTQLGGNYSNALESYRNGVVDIRAGITIDVPATLTNGSTPNAIWAGSSSVVRIRNSGIISLVGNIDINSASTLTMQAGTFSGNMLANNGTIRLSDVNHTNSSSRAISMAFNSTFKANNSTLGNTFIFGGSVGEINGGTVSGIEANHGSVISINASSVTDDVIVRLPSSTHIFGSTKLNNNNIYLCNQIGAYVDGNTIGILNSTTFTTDCAP